MMLLSLLLSCHKSPATDDSPQLQHSDDSPRDDSAPDDSPGDDSADDSADDTADDTAPPGPVLVFDRPPRNVLMIVLDTLRRDAVGRYGGGDTPTLDRLLAEGVALDNHRSCSNWTLPSVLCVQSGSYAWELGFPYEVETGPPGIVPEEVELVSEDLASRGYQASLVSAQPFMSVPAGTAAGFGAVFYNVDYIAEQVVQAGLQRVSAFDPTQPWYLHLHFIDTHALYSPPEAYREALDALEPIPFDLDSEEGFQDMLVSWNSLDSAEQALILQHLQARYRAELRYFDDELARLLTRLDEVGALEDTLVVFWSDHGEQLYQHGSATHTASMYEEETAAVAFFWSPRLAARAWSGPTTHADLWPTVYAAMGWSGPAFTGQPVGQRPADDAQHILRFRGEDSLQAVVVGDRKLIYAWDGQKELYHLDTDPGETQNLYDAADPEVIALWERLSPEIEKVQTTLGGSPVDPGP